MLPGGILVRLIGLHGRHSERPHATHDGEGQTDDGEQHYQATAVLIWRLVIVISRRHRSSRISASGNVQQKFVFLILVHFLPRRITSQPSKKEARPLRRY